MTWQHHEECVCIRCLPQLSRHELKRERAEHALTKLALELACKDLEAAQASANSMALHDQARAELAQFKERAAVMAGAVWEGTRVDHVRRWFHELAGLVPEAKPPGLTAQEWAAKCKDMTRPAHVFQPFRGERMCMWRGSCEGHS